MPSEYQSATSVEAFAERRVVVGLRGGRRRHAWTKTQSDQNLGAIFSLFVVLRICLVRFVWIKGNLWRRWSVFSTPPPPPPPLTFFTVCRPSTSRRISASRGETTWKVTRKRRLVSCFFFALHVIIVFSFNLCTLLLMTTSIYHRTFTALNVGLFCFLFFFF